MRQCLVDLWARLISVPAADEDVPHVQHVIAQHDLVEGITHPIFRQTESSIEGFITFIAKPKALQSALANRFATEVLLLPW